MEKQELKDIYTSNSAAWGRSLSGLSPGLSGMLPGQTIEILTEKKILARIIRYTVVPKDLKIVEALGNEAVLLTGVSVIKGPDIAGFYFDIAGSVANVLKTANDKLSTRVWYDKDGISRTFAPISTSDIDVVVEDIKKYS